MFANALHPEREAVEGSKWMGRCRNKFGM